MQAISIVISAKADKFTVQSKSSKRPKPLTTQDIHVSDTKKSSMAEWFTSFLPEPHFINEHVTVSCYHAPYIIHADVGRLTPRECSARTPTRCSPSILHHHSMDHLSGKLTSPECAEQPPSISLPSSLGLPDFFSVHDHSMALPGGETDDVLYCIVLYYSVKYCIALYCIVSYCYSGIIRHHSLDLPGVSCHYTNIPFKTADDAWVWVNRSAAC